MKFKTSKRLLPVLLASMMAAPASQAADKVSADVSGFADISLLLRDDSEKLVGRRFIANGEIDLTGSKGAVSGRVDLDLALATNGGANASAATGGPADSAVIEQAYFAWGGIEGLTVLGGVFNNPIGWEAEDAPDMYQFSHGQIWNILDGQTALYGNNVAGVAAAANLGGVNLTVGFLNDIGLATNTKGTRDQNSVALVADTGDLVDGVKVEFGYVTQDGPVSAGSAGNVWDLNGTLDMAPIKVGLEFLGGANTVDLAWGLTGVMDMGHDLGLTLRYDNVSFSNSDVTKIAAANPKGLPASVSGLALPSSGSDVNTITGAVSYQAEENLTVILEVQGTDTGNTQFTRTNAEFVVTF